MYKKWILFSVFVKYYVLLKGYLYYTINDMECLKGIF